MNARHPLPAVLSELFPDQVAGDRIWSAQLPAGRVVVSSEEAEHPPVYWLSDGPAPAGLWSQLRAEHTSSGLWPVLLGPSYRRTSMEPWTSGEMYPSGMSQPDQHDPNALFADWWRQYTATSDDDMLSTHDRIAITAPFGQRWPGLAPTARSGLDPDDTADRVVRDLLAGHPTMRIALIAADSGADALTTAGWSGPANYTNDAAKISAVIRIWQDRFGVRVVGLAGYATLYLSVAAPPTSFNEAVHVAAEHFALCPDNIWQGAKPHTLAAYAERLIDEQSWTFWWD